MIIIIIIYFLGASPRPQPPPRPSRPVRPSLGEGGGFAPFPPDPLSRVAKLVPKQTKHVLYDFLRFS